MLYDYQIAFTLNTNSHRILQTAISIRNIKVRNITKLIYKTQQFFKIGSALSLDEGNVITSWTWRIEMFSCDISFNRKLFKVQYTFPLMYTSWDSLKNKFKDLFDARTLQLRWLVANRITKGKKNLLKFIKK